MHFTLVEFHGDGIVTVDVSLKEKQLELRFAVDVDYLINWPPAGETRRADELWQSTCFECFIGNPLSEAYLEINLSPSGSWNGYQFTGYRSGMATSASVTLNELSTGSGILASRLTLSMPIQNSLYLGPAAVLAEPTGQLHYFALSHGDEPDFHGRERHVLVTADQL